MDTFEIIRYGQDIKIRFKKPAQNDEMVKDALLRLDEMAEKGELSGGGPIKINGPASLPVVMVIGHALANRFEYVSIFDPRLNRYVVVISNDPAVKVGDLVN